MKNAKILCTLGPSTDGKVKELIAAGMNGARFNLSHGTFEENLRRVKEVRQASKDIFIVFDTIGPKMRLGDFEPRQIKEGDEVILSSATPRSRRVSDVPVAFKKLPQYVSRGDRILVEDGLIGLLVRSVKKDKIFCRVLYGSELKPRKGVNVPNVKIPFPYTSHQDKQNIRFAIEAGVDFVADSFVRNRKDVKQLKARLKGTDIRIISKIENFEGVNHFDEILDESDGIMVARGDLGVEMPIEAIPLLQKQMIRKCNQAGKPVVTATQMLESMIHNRTPTRAEANDVFNAIVDGSDCVMLSGETSIGSYPIEVVRTMRKIINGAWHFTETHVDSVDDESLISHAVANSAKSKSIKAIVVPTVRGLTVRMTSRFMLKKPIYAVTTSDKLNRQLNILWGVETFKGPIVKQEKIVESTIKLLLRKKVLRKKDQIIITCGFANKGLAHTNMMQIIRI